MRIALFFIIVVCCYIYGAHYATQSLHPDETVVARTYTVQKSTTKEISLHPLGPTETHR